MYIFRYSKVDIGLQERHKFVRARPLIQHQSSEIVEVSMLPRALEILLLL
jgi:hypothetical protein